MKVESKRSVPLADWHEQRLALIQATRARIREAHLALMSVERVHEQAGAPRGDVVQLSAGGLERARLASDLLPRQQPRW